MMSTQGPQESNVAVPCLFCRLNDRAMLAEEGPCFAVYDKFPVATFHALIIPRRHMESFRDMNQAEWLAVHALARKLASDLKRQDPTIDGYNLGINDGVMAGQSILHAHIHWIPRRRGDVANPRGGVRGIIPGKADYPPIQ